MARPRLRWPLTVYRVAGHSMQPTYQPGDTLLGWRWARPRPGQVVVAHHAGRPLIKRLTKLTPEGAWLQGDNPAASTDSRQFGTVPPSSLQAVIMCRLP